MPVHVLGWGTTSALGVGTAAALEVLRAGRRPIGVPRFAPHLAPTPGGPCPVFEVPLQDDCLHRRARTIVDTATDEAIAAAGGLGSNRVGVFAGTTGGFFADAEYGLLEERKTDPDAWPAFVQRGPGALAAHVVARLGATGPMATFTTACTSTGVAFAAAARHLRAGTCDRAVVVGFDTLSSLTLHGFRSLLLIDPKPCRPFDRSRNGLQLGEAAGVVVLGRSESRWRVGGTANILDASHVTSSATDGSTAEALMRQALHAGALGVEDVASIKAHGTGTVDNDRAEGNGIRRLFPEPPPFASLKGYVGHTLGAAASLELGLWLGCIEAGFLPASAGFVDQDPEIGVCPLVKNQVPRRGAHLFNGFGFGGSCVCQVVVDV